MRHYHRSRLQLSLPGVKPNASGMVKPSRRLRFAHKKILQNIEQVSGGGRTVAEIYRSEVLPIKTRTIQLLGRKSPARIINTLLGFEVQSSYKRISCPDMVTARYLKLFTELGCRSIKLPYDLTVTDRIISELELAMNRISAEIRALFPGERAAQIYVLRKVYIHLRSRLHSQ